MVKAINLSKTFSTGKGQVVRAVDGLSFEAQPGEVFGLLGCNGAGKTTAMRMLSTLIRPTSGDAFVGGSSVVDDAIGARAAIGFLSNSAALYGRLKPVELLRYFGQLNGLGGKQLESRIEFCVQTLGIGDYADRTCDKLSTGQKQRVSVARAILADPPILFFDEPTAGLDVVSGQIILEFIEDAKARGKTVIFSTHIMSEAQRLCDHVLIIHEGKTRAHGTVASLMEQEQKPTFEAAFLSLVGYQRGTSNP